MNHDELYQRYQDLQQYVGWSEEDAGRVQAVAELLEPYLRDIIDDFYTEIERHPGARQVITGGQEQISRLKGTLRGWLRELLSGPYDRGYVLRRWQVGWRHVEIGLDQVYTNVALSRIRAGLTKVLQESWQAELPLLRATVRSLNKLLDLDLAIIEDAYQAEYAARLQRGERLATIGQVAGAVPCMIVVLRPDHTILYFSHFAQELTGYSSASVVGKNYFSIFLPAEYHPAVGADIERVLAGIPRRGFENPVVCKDGSRRWMIWNADRLVDYEGGVAVLAVGQDITSLKRAQEQALQSERLAAIGQMMTGLAHESGNALARSQACLDMLSWEVEDRPEAVDLIERIRQAQNHLQQLYDEVRGYAAPLNLEREVWDLSTIWRQAWENLALARRGKDTALVEDVGEVDLHCKVDHFRLEQVFRNILDNSLAACAGPVRIHIGCAETKLERRPAVRIALRDNGPGLTAEQKQRIFEPFFTTKTKGTGLGMAIAKRIVDAHAGQIAVGQAPGSGAEILITLPRDNHEPISPHRRR